MVRQPSSSNKKIHNRSKGTRAQSRTVLQNSLGWWGKLTQDKEGHAKLFSRTRSVMHELTTKEETKDASNNDPGGGEGER